MAQCFEPYCSVDPASGALSITTKGGTCTVVPGDQVSVTENLQGWIITVNGAPTLIPRIDPGDDVSFLETPDNYVITINGVPHLIPKCRYYRDCDGNILDTCERIVTCDDLAGRGFISCVDADDFNMVARVVDGEAAMCLEIAWDRICAEAELVTDPAGHTVLMCGPGGVKKIDPNDLLSELCFNDVPDLGSQCGVVDQLVLVTNNGCGSLAKTRAATQAQSVLYFQQVASPRLPDNTGGYSIPGDLPNPSNYYTRADYVSDGGVNTASGVTGGVRPAPGLDEAKVSNSRWGSASWENACPNTYELEVNIAHVKMGSAEAAYDAWSGVGFRFRVNGGDWNYPFSPGPGTLNIFAGDNGLLGTRQVSTQLGIPAGAIDFEVFYIGNTTPETTVGWQANTFVPGFAVSSPRAFLRRAA